MKMRIISLFAFTLVSICLLSQSYHYAGAIGINSASHGLLYRGRVVRRYGISGYVYKGLQRRAAPKVIDAVPAKNATGNPTKGSTKGTGPELSVQTTSKSASPTEKPTPKLTPTPKQTPKAKGGKGSSVQGQDDTTDNKPTNSQLDTQDQEDQNGGVGTPTVAVDGMSTPAVAGLVSVGGVFVLVGGLFAFSKRRKNKEITKSIVSNSSKAWEQQNSVYEVMEEEPKPIGSYTVIATYTPTLADELDIQPGDKVTILVEYDDGWVQGVNETRGGMKGVFPRHCVDMNNSSNKPKNINRSSSMGGFTSERYTEVDLS